MLPGHIIVMLMVSAKLNVAGGASQTRVSRPPRRSPRASTAPDERLYRNRAVVGPGLTSASSLLDKCQVVTSPLVVTVATMKGESGAYPTLPTSRH